MNYDEALKALAGDGKTFDQEAKSIDECLPYFGGLKRCSVERRLDEAITGGTWEQVWKRNPTGRIVKAYRPKGTE
jgi:hypothetical protein